LLTCLTHMIKCMHCILCHLVALLKYVLVSC
jgi:hypothetical protein